MRWKAKALIVVALTLMTQSCASVCDTDCQKDVARVTAYCLALAAELVAGSPGSRGF